MLIIVTFSRYKYILIKLIMPMMLINMNDIAITLSYLKNIYILPPLLFHSNYQNSTQMRFSSDEELFEQQSNNQQQHNQKQKANLIKKKQKKQTMLSKFLDSIDQNLVSKLHNYEKLKRPIFERRAIVPQKLTLYEDVLFILVFKENQTKILSDSKQIKSVCLDLESRTKRKQCTIRERIQKKLCKMTPGDLLDHIEHDKDISFNLKKVLTSGGKAQSERTINRSEIQITPLKEKIEQNKTPIKQAKINAEQVKSEEKQQEKVEMEFLNSASKQNDEIFFENQNEKVENPSTPTSIEDDEKEIFIVFKKNQSQGEILMFNNLLIQKEINAMKKKQQQEEQRQELMNQLKIQMDIILHFKNKASQIPQQVKALILEAQKIMRILGISSLNNVEIHQKKIEAIEQQKPHPTKIHDETADKNVQDQEKANQKTTESKEISQFITIQKEEDHQTDQLEKKQEKYTVSYSLCNIDEYIKLYNSNPQVFQPLLWTEDEDVLIEKLIENFESNEKLFNLLVRYKGPEMFIERCIFLGKPMTNKVLNDAIKACKPLNVSRLNGYLSNFEEKKEPTEQKDTISQNVNQMAIEC